MRVNGKVLGVVIIFAVLGAAAGYKFFLAGKDGLLAMPDLKTLFTKTVQARGAVGGGKEGLMADPALARILKAEAKVVSLGEAWSNGKMVKSDVSGYDYLFFSDQRFYDYYQLPSDQARGEAPRVRPLSGGIVLSTPIVIYSWDKVARALADAGLAREVEGVWYLSGLDRLLELMAGGKQWKDIGLSELYGPIGIASTDPVTSSPGATWYGLLASVMNGGQVDEAGLQAVLPRLGDYYVRSGFMNQSPADLFESYLRQGMGAHPMIVDYEKSVIEFALHNPEDWEALKGRIRVLYPLPGIWNAHCIAALTPQGQRVHEGFRTKKARDLAWMSWGFRTGTAGGAIDPATAPLAGLAPSLDSVVPPLRKAMYDDMIAALALRAGGSE